MKKKDNVKTVTLMPDMDDFATFAFQTLNQKCYQFVPSMNKVFQLDLSNIGCIELPDFYSKPMPLPVFFYNDERRETYQLVDISGNDRIKELKGYDKLLIMTGDVSKRKAMEIEDRFREVEGGFHLNRFRFDDPTKDAKRQEKLKLYFGSLVLLLEEHRMEHKNKREEMVRFRQTLKHD